MAPLSIPMQSLLHKIKAAGPTGYECYAGRTTDALMRRGLIDFEPVAGSIYRLRWRLTEAGKERMNARAGR